MLNLQKLNKFTIEWNQILYSKPQGHIVNRLLKARYQVWRWVFNFKCASAACFTDISSWFSISELVEGLEPFEIRFLNQVPWNLGLPLPEFPEDWGATIELLDATPARYLYATLLALTISVFACLNCKRKRKQSCRREWILIKQWEQRSRLEFNFLGIRQEGNEYDYEYQN